MIVELTPIMMLCVAAGTCTHHMSWRSAQPDMRPDSTIPAGASARPGGSSTAPFARVNKRALGAVHRPQVTARQLDLVRAFASRLRNRSTT
ncbi:MAG: hypothetical protein IIA73_04990 [Proteobacteria bacterium]|nr:hypothetical protein [Pseudomonadota bacterium]